MVYSNILEVAQSMTPLLRPKSNLPIFITLKFSDRDNIEPMRANKLKYIKVLRGPTYLTKSPPNNDPALIPMIDAVDSTVI